MKRLALFVHSYPPAKGGLEYLAEKLYQGLSEEFEVHVFTGQGSNLDSYKNFSSWVSPKQQSERVHRLPLKMWHQRLANWVLRPLLSIFPSISVFYFGPILKYSNEEFHIIQSCDCIIGMGLPTKSLLDAAQFAKKFSKPLITVPAFHQHTLHQQSSFFTQVFQASKKILFLSPAEQKYFSQSYTVPDEHKQQLHFAPFTQAEIQKQHKLLHREVERRVKHFHDKKITIGYVGQLSTRKNLEVVMDFLRTSGASLREKGWECSLLLAGAKTNSSQEIEEKCRELSIPVNFIYDFPEHTKHDIFQSIDVFINPSIEESLGITNFEAAFYGVPTIIHKASAFASLEEMKFITFRQQDELSSLLEQCADTSRIKQHMLDQFAVFREYNYTQFSAELTTLVKDLLNV